MIVYKNILVERKDTWLTVPDKVPVTVNFYRSTPPAGHAVLTKGTSGIFADLYLNEGRQYGGLYPAIGFTAEKDLSSGKVTELSLCDQRNEDEGIPPLPELSITVQRPKACKFCEHWGSNPGTNQNGVCQSITDADVEIAGNHAKIEAFSPAGLITGPDFYCAHFKGKVG